MEQYLSDIKQPLRFQFKKVLLSSFLLLFGTVHAQSDSIRKFLNDNRRSVFSNVIKTDILQIAEGNILFVAEHDFTGYFRMEGGIGFLSSSNYNPIYMRIYRDGTDPFNKNGLQKIKMKPGISLYFSPRFPFRRLPQYYLSINTLLNTYFGQLLEGKISITYGKEITLVNNLILDINGGLGIDRHWSFDEYYYMHKLMFFKGKDPLKPNSISFFPALGIKIGYRLNH